MFSLRQLRYFEALARHGNFKLAAEACSISQPALSVQIAEMEKTAGNALFERTRKGIILTPLGRQIAEPISDILKRMVRLNDIINTDGPKLKHHFRLGVIPTIAPYLLPSLLPACSKDMSNLTFEIHEAKTEQLAAQLQEGEIDAVIAASPFYDEMASKHLFNDPFFLATAKSIEQPQAIPITIQDIDERNLILLEEGHCLRDQVLQVCNRRLYQRNISASSLSTLVQLVANDLGITLIPQIAIKTENRDASLAIWPFKAPLPSREINLYWRAKSPRHKDFVRLAKLIASISEGILNEAHAYIKPSFP